MVLCKHQPHTVIDWVKEPKYSTDEVLLDKEAVDGGQEHILVKFKQCTKYPDWFYMSRKVVRRHRTQPNGRILVYVVSMNKRESFEINNKCEHE